MNIRTNNKKIEKYITLQEAAKIYNCTQRHMSLVARQGKLKAVKLGRNWFTTLKWLNDFIKITKPVFSQKNTNGNGKYISLKEASKAYGCTQRHINLIARQGKLKAIKKNGNWITTFAWLKEYSRVVKKTKKTKQIKERKIFFVQKPIAIALTSILIFILISTAFVSAKHGKLFDPIIGKISKAYSSTFNLTKDSIGSLVFDYSKVIKKAFNSSNVFNNLVSKTIKETDDILTFVFEVDKEKQIISNNLERIVFPTVEKVFKFAELYTYIHKNINNGAMIVYKEIVNNFDYNSLEYSTKSINILSSVFTKSGEFIIKTKDNADKIIKSPIVFTRNVFSATKNFLFGIPKAIKSAFTFNLFSQKPEMSEQSFISIKDLYKRLSHIRDSIYGKTIVISETDRKIIQEIKIINPKEIIYEREILSKKDQEILEAWKLAILADLDRKISGIEGNVLVQNNYYYEQAVAAGGFNVSNNEVTFNENVDMNKNLTVVGTITGGIITDGTLSIIGGNITGGGDFTFTRASVSDSLTVTDIIRGGIITDGTSILTSGNLTGLIYFSTQHASISDDLTVIGPVTLLSDLLVDTNTLFIDSTNNYVGIGTITPSVELSVYGTASISEDLIASGSVQFGGGQITTVSYSRFGSGATNHSLSDAHDLFVTGNLEIDGSAYFDGSTTFTTSSVSNDFEVGDGIFYVNTGSESYQFGGTGTASFVGPVEILNTLEATSASFTNLFSPIITDGTATLTNGNLTGINLLSFTTASGSDNLEVASAGFTNLWATTITDNTLTITGGSLTGGQDFSLVRASISDSLTVSDIIRGGTLTDGTAILTGGNWTGIGSLTATTLTDGTATLTSGNFTGLTGLTSTLGTFTHASISDDLTIGVNTVFRDGYIDSSGALSINTTNNQAINLGTGLLS
ncbi:hypothetical protein KJ684_02160, partial [Patescibacteria group bacterium]|nr:hypothetical protein [Patescibacteria group bacterium]